MNLCDFGAPPCMNFTGCARRGTDAPISLIEVEATRRDRAKSIPKKQRWMTRLSATAFRIAPELRLHF
eukprot:890931-Amphidinium_carterae.1